MLLRPNYVASKKKKIEALWKRKEVDHLHCAKIYDVSRDHGFPRYTNEWELFAVAVRIVSCRSPLQRTLLGMQSVG